MQVQRPAARASAGIFDRQTSYVFCTRFYDHVEPCSCRTLYVFDRAAPPLRAPISGTLDGVVKICQQEGVFGLWRGLWPTLLMALPATAVYYVGYEKIKGVAVESWWAQALDPHARDTVVPLVAGSTARLAAASLISPLELLKTKMQHRGGEGGMRAVGAEIVAAARSGGLRVLYRGLVPTLWRDVPFSAIYWAGYERFRVVYARLLFAQQRTMADDFTLSFCAGASSGTIAAALTTPFDVAKTRQQVLPAIGGSTARAADSAGILANLAEIWRTEGAAGLMRGLVPRVCKVAPACAIMVGSYEFGKNYFSSHRQPRTP